MSGASRAEPYLLPDSDSDLSDEVSELLQKSSAIGGSVPAPIRTQLEGLCRVAGSYYSNLIEGHQIHPEAIEKALSHEFVAEDRQRSLQKEAKAHIDLQAMIDVGRDLPVWPTSSTYVKWLHREFFSRLPDDMLWVDDKRTGERIRLTPGDLRTRHVEVGRHYPPEPETLDAFMARFDEAYDKDRLNNNQNLISAAAAHHRLLWIHPFLDGNGRVARLMSHALLLRLGVGNSLWSVARGLANRVEDYKSSLCQADSPRRGDFDGRGALSLGGLKDFCRFFLNTCIDQVDFMNTLLEPSDFLRRIELYSNDEIAAGRLPKGSFEMLREAFYQGDVPRGPAAAITGYEDRRARETLSALLEKGLLVPTNARGPVTLGFPVHIWHSWFPSLFISTKPNSDVPTGDSSASSQ